jgi:hypothetical protein
MRPRKSTTVNNAPLSNPHFGNPNLLTRGGVGGGMCKIPRRIQLFYYTLYAEGKGVLLSQAKKKKEDVDWRPENRREA